MDNLALEVEENTSSVDANNMAHSGGNLSISETIEHTSQEDQSIQENKIVLSLLKKLTPSRGMLMALLASILFSCVDVSIELATHEVHPNLVLVMYPNVVIVFSLVGIVITGAKVRYNIKQYIFLVISGGFYAGGITCLALAISKIPVGDAVALLNCMPIFGGIFGWILLKQSLRILDIFFGILCIAGVVLIARPTFIFPDLNDENQTDVTGTLFALAAACFLALGFTTGRKNQDIDIHILCILFTNAASTVLLNCILCTVMNAWTAPSPSYYWAIAFAPGLFDFFAQTSVFMALKMERAVMVTIILTTEIVFTFVLQILIIKIVPPWYSAVGSFLILMSCIGMATRKTTETQHENS